MLFNLLVKASQNLRKSGIKSTPSMSGMSQLLTSLINNPSGHFDPYIQALEHH